MYKKINDMAYTDFIAAIDLGTSRIVGMVERRTSTEFFPIIAYEVETPVTASGGMCI